MPYKDNLRKLIIPAGLTSGDNTIIAAGQMGAGLGAIKVWQMSLQASAAVTVIPKTNTTIIAGTVIFPAAGNQIYPNADTPWMETLPGQALTWNLSVGGGVLSGTIWFRLA